MGTPLREAAELHDFWQQEKRSSSLLRPEQRELVLSPNSSGRGTDAAKGGFRASCAQLEHHQQVVTVGDPPLWRIKEPVC